MNARFPRVSELRRPPSMPIDNARGMITAALLARPSLDLHASAQVSQQDAVPIHLSTPPLTPFWPTSQPSQAAWKTGRLL
jgi:hypothetical protein